MEPDNKKRRTLTILTGLIAGSGIVAASIPFFSSLKPSSEKTFPVRDVDISKLEEGQMLSIVIFNKPLYILKRSNEVLDTLKLENPILLDPNSINSVQPKNAQNIYRSIKPEILVAWGMCTHLGCKVSHNPPTVYTEERFKKGVYFCPCHGAVYDLSGRVHKNMPAPRNLDVPNYKYISESVIQIEMENGF